MAFRFGEGKRLSREYLKGELKSPGKMSYAILGALVLFIFPSRDGGRVPEWRTAVNIPWGIVLLFGGGFALAHSFSTDTCYDIRFVCVYASCCYSAQCDYFRVRAG